MKIFNKIVWSKKEPVNKNDIWFDGSTFRAYTEGSWEIIIQNNGGEPIDPETIEGFIPLMREFSDDFNNDFSR
jgi:hypothetical protein